LKVGATTARIQCPNGTVLEFPSGTGLRPDAGAAPKSFKDKATVYRGIQVTPDWQHSGTAESIAHQFKFDHKEFQFKGPGFYLSDTDTLVIVPRVEHPSFKKDWPKETVFTAYVYNTPFSGTVFSWNSIIPVRDDRRNLEAKV
jgi:hypothetical protein